MSNTPRQGSAYIITGVDNRPGRPNKVVGIDSHEDDNHIQNLLRSWLNPVPQVSYAELEYEGKWVGVYEISTAQMQGPFFLRSDLTRDRLKHCGEFLNPDLLYFRRGTTNDWARETDKEYLADWFRSHRDRRWQDWGEFKASCSNFDDRHHFILIASSLSHLAESGLAAFANVNWSAVFDFHPSSEENGLLNAVASSGYNRNIIRSVKGDSAAYSPSRSTYWFFARGIKGRQETLPRHDDWRTWRRDYGSVIDHQFEQLTRALPPAAVTFIVLWNDDERARFLQSTLEAAAAYFDDANIVVVSDTASRLKQRMGHNITATFFEIPVGELASGLAVELPSSSTEAIEFALPSGSGAPVGLPSSKIAWLQSQLDIVHLGIRASSAASNGRNDVEHGFLRGGTVTWEELDLGKDAARDLTASVTRRLRQELRDRSTSRIDIFHKPGAGGTTVARRALWDLHKDFPCVLILSGDSRGIVERIDYIAALTRQTVLALVDSADIAEREIEDLHRLLQSRNTGCVLLCVSRRHSLPQQQTRRSFKLESRLSPLELPRFADKFVGSAPHREKEIRKICADNSRKHQTAFFFGLSAYGKDYMGLESYIATRIISLSQPQIQLLTYLSIAYRYGQRGLAPQAFQHLLGLSKRDVSVPLVFSESASVLDILIEEGNANEWRPIHHVVADELVQQILSSGSSDRRAWKQNLSKWGKQFIEFCATHQAVVSERMLDLLRRVFIYRDGDDALGQETNDDTRDRASRLASFSLFIRDIPSREGRLEVLKYLAKTIPNEAHFWAHLSRYQSAIMTNFEASMESVDKAISLQRDDPLLWHMKGMSFRYHAQSLMSGTTVALGIVVELAEKASECFEESRNINPDREHAYISEIQLLASVLNYAVKDTDESIFQFAQRQHAPPYLREAFDRAESLLAVVRANREGTRGSSYEEGCRARISGFYGDYQEALQIWDSLLSRHDVFHPPVRRQIVYAHIDRSQSWNKMSNKGRDRCIQLLQDNLDEQPYNASDLRLWLQAVRFASPSPTIESLIEKVSYWKANSDALDATYYLYVLYWLQAIEGLTYERDLADRFMQESLQLSQNRRNRLRSFEWLGNGHGISRLVHQSVLGNWNRDKNFWSNANSLSRVEGVISEVRGPERGTLQVDGMSCFFVPGAKREDPISKDHVNQRVDFYIGFSYSGVRAWDVKLL